uniref:CFA20 domain-containing protein n=1 Tax=Eptatretus burgeri TaxID=7764 RepID=A0A8C4QWK5_EPTBU
MPTKAFVIHLDLVTKGDLVIRVSFSNIFKEFKFTSTWLQFPFIDEGEKGSVSEHTSQRDIGPTTGSSRWTCLVLDLLAILSVYLTQQYSSLKAIKLCSCLLLKNVFTSDVIYLPGVSFLEAKRRGLIAQGLNAMPRDMAFPVPKGKIWEDMYDYIRCPNNASQLAFDSMRNNVQGLNPMPRDMVFPIPKGRSLEHGGSLLKEPHMSANESHQKLPKAMKPCMNPKMELLVTRTLPRVHVVAMPNTRAHKHGDETFHQESPRMMMRPAGHSRTPAGTIKFLLGGSESSVNAAAIRASRSSAKLIKYEDSLVVEENVSSHRGVSTRPLNHATAGVPSARHAMVRAPPGPTSYRHFLPYLNNSGSFQEQSYHEKGKQPIHLKSILGYNGNARANIVWYTSSGLLAYSCGRILILEELQSGKQRYLAAHMEEISTLAQSHDHLVLASASGTRDWTVSQMCLWDVHGGTLKETLQHLHREVQAMAFSADDRFLLSAGDYRDGWLALWSMNTFERLARVQAPCPINDVASDLTDSAIFLCAGTQALLICHLDFHLGQTSLQVSKASMPNEMDATELSSVAFSPHGVIYTGTILGKVCAWNTHQRCCFLSWDADCGDIGVLLCRRHKILSGSERKNLKLWNVRDLLNFIDKETPSDTKVMLEQEMLLDGAVTAAVFDDDLDMGVVGTMAGTVWYIGWMDGSSTRLLSGHPGEVIALAVSLDGDALASATRDGNLRVWDLQEMELSVQFHVHKQDC